MSISGVCCVHCSLTAAGHHDPSDGAFYCEQCWKDYEYIDDDDDDDDFIAEAPPPVSLAAFVISRPLAQSKVSSPPPPLTTQRKTGKHEEAMARVRQELHTLGITLPHTYSLKSMEAALRGYQFLVAELGDNAVFTFQWPLLTLGGFVSYEISPFYPEDLPTIIALEPKHISAVRYVSSRLAVLRHRQIVSLTFAVIQRMVTDDVDGYSAFNEICLPNDAWKQKWKCVPEVTLIRVFAFLPLSSLASAMRVSRSFCELAQNDNLWSDLYKRCFPVPERFPRDHVPDPVRPGSHRRYRFMHRLFRDVIQDENAALHSLGLDTVMAYHAVGGTDDIVHDGIRWLLAARANIIFKMFHEGKKYLEKVRDECGGDMWSQTDGFAAWGIPTSEAELESEIKAVFLKTLDSHEAQEWDVTRRAVGAAWGLPVVRVSSMKQPTARVCGWY